MTGSLLLIYSKLSLNRSLYICLCIDVYQLDEGGTVFASVFFFNNNIFCDVLGYEDGVLKSWLMACLKRLLIFHVMTKPNFDFRYGWGARGPEVGRKRFLSRFFTKNPQKSSYTYISILAIIWLIQFFYIFVNWDSMWSRSGP